MTHIIVAGTEGSREDIEKAARRLSSLPECTVTIVSTSRSDSFSERWIETTEAEFATRVAEAVSSSPDSYVILVDGRVALSPASMHDLVKAVVESSPQGVEIPSIVVGGETHSPLSNQTEHLLSEIARASQPMVCIATSREFAEKKIQGRSFHEVAMNLVIDAMASSTPVNELSAMLGADSPQTPFAAPSADVKATLMRRAIQNCNLEDLFPNHPWSSHENESAAACFHALAATFIRLGDMAGAAECLSMADKLEDSPRSLAMKGILAMQRGETLGAVANMVSSLKQYELRKRNDGTHYLHFMPNDMQVVTQRLTDGLSALNHHDNERALENFAHAVFDFDPFYNEHGIAVAKDRE